MRAYTLIERRVGCGFSQERNLFKSELMTGSRCSLQTTESVNSFGRAAVVASIVLQIFDGLRMPSIPKARQASKIKEIGETLMDLGFMTLDQQSKTLGLSRSTTWTVLKAPHKGSGLSARVINQMLSSPHLPPAVRERIASYLEDRLAGKHGHTKMQLNRFARQLENNPRPSGFDLPLARDILE